MSESVRVGLVGVCGVGVAGGWFGTGVWVSAFPRERLGLVSWQAARAGVGRRRSAGLVGSGAGGSGERGERADRVEHGGEVGLPWPAGGEAECPLAAGAGQPSGDLQEVTPAGVGGLDGCGG